MVLLPQDESRRLTSAIEFRKVLDTISKALRSAIDKVVPINKPLPNTKRWRTHELTDLWKAKNQLPEQSHRWRGHPDHPSHQAHRDASKDYAATTEASKEEHWESWLFNASGKGI